MGPYSILVSPDSFKGSLTADEAAGAIAEGLRKGGFKGRIDLCPMSDGGEGFGSIVKNHKNVKVVETITIDALGRKIATEYLWDEDSKTAYLESASAIGIERIAEENRDPFKASSRGLGRMIKDAIKKGASHIFVSLGGSATSDGGMGMMAELGIKFIDKAGKILNGNGEDMIKIEKIDSESMVSRIKEVSLYAVCDVGNPLLGPSGAVYTFAKQKGAKVEDLPILEEGMSNLCKVLEENGVSLKENSLMPGSGAAGGLGYSLQSVFNANYIRGIDFIKSISEFKEKLMQVDLVITGEGSIDSQSLMGKVLSGIIAESKPRDIPVLAFAGKVKDRDMLLSNGLTDVIEISDPSLSHTENMKKEQAILNLKRAVSYYFSSHYK